MVARFFCVIYCNNGQYGAYAEPPAAFPYRNAETRIAAQLTIAHGGYAEKACYLALYRGEHYAISPVRKRGAQIFRLFLNRAEKAAGIEHKIVRFPANKPRKCHECRRVAGFSCPHGEPFSVFQRNKLH